MTFIVIRVWGLGIPNWDLPENFSREFPGIFFRISRNTAKLNILIKTASKSFL